MSFEAINYLTLKQLCEELSISLATGKNWVKLGKITPDGNKDLEPSFSREYVDNLKKEILSGENKALKSRRNKKYVSGNGLYTSYVSEDCKSVYEVRKLLGLIEENDIELTKEVVQYFVADCALRLFSEKDKLPFAGQRGTLQKFAKGEISIGKYDELVRALIDDADACVRFCQENSLLFDLNYYYEFKEDILGLIYISCINYGNRKAKGAYYTPNTVVKKLIRNLQISDGKSVLDPCCGTGNFLLQLPDFARIDAVYGYDIDPICIKISRINMALRFAGADLNTICEHFTEKNFLLEKNDIKFDYIIGNPPWGFEFSEKEKVELKLQYIVAVGKNIESYDVFLEQGLKNLQKDGVLAFVLPEAILNVKAHMPIRRYILEEDTLSFIEYLGDAFDGVQCPCILMGVAKTEGQFSTVGLRINDGKRKYVINADRRVSEEYFSFLTTDDEYEIIEKVRALDNTRFLLNNADFALGIVTGDNKKYISDVKTDFNEMVLKGSDICKYHINQTDNYIVFEPENFQQVAPTQMYRAPEKLLYRFICNQLVFAYDDKQTLSLNSCNVMVPHLEGAPIKYILAILNSRIAQFIYKKEFNSVKILRSHIESIPIPIVDEETQKKVIEVVDQLIEGKVLKDAERLYDELDTMIFDIFDISLRQRAIVKEAVDGENKFLA